MPGCQPTPEFEVGANVVCPLTGQMFTNLTGEPLQTATGGFSGATDKSAPWKTLAELLAVYQQGDDLNKVRGLYTDSSREFFDKMLANQEVAPKMKAYYSLAADLVK